MLSDSIYVIVVAAGCGSRFGSALPKQFCDLGGRPVLMHTIDRLRQALPEAGFIVVLNKGFIGFWEKSCEAHSFVSPRIVTGGETRWRSVKNALDEAVPDDAGVVLVHDGARPVVDRRMVHRIVGAMSSCAGAVPVVPVNDSLRRLCDGGDSVAVDRNCLMAVQTPQAFDASILKEAYRQPYSVSFTDDASVVEAAGYSPIALVDGDPCNIKITNPRDLDVAAIYLGMR